MSDKCDILIFTQNGCGMIEFVRFFIYVLLVVVACVTVYYGLRFIEYSWNVIVSKTPPFVPANSTERAAVVQQINMFYPHAKTVLELGSGYGELARYIAQNTSAHVVGVEKMPGAALISWVLDKLYRVNSRTVWGNIYQYLENMNGRADIAVMYMGPNVNIASETYLNKFDVLISVDFEIPDISPVRVIDVGNGYTRYAGKKYPHRLYVYEFNHV